MSEQDQVKLSDYEERMEKLARVRALILKLVNAQPGLTVEQLSKEFMLAYGFLPRIDNRLRELRAVGFVESRYHPYKKLLHWYPKREEEKAKE